MSTTSDAIPIDDLTAELAELRRRLDQLQAQVALTEGRARTSLRTNLRCPLCGCTTILHAPRVLDRADAGYREALSIHQPSAWSQKGIGQLELYVCRQCGLAEWYVRDAATLEADGEVIREIDGSSGAPPNPYR